MNSTCQIYKRFNSFYIVLPETLNCITFYDHCEHLRVAHIAHNVYYKHSTDYKLHCTCDTVRLMLNTISSLQDFCLKISCSSLMSSQHMTQILNLFIYCQRLINHLQLSINNMHSCCECVSDNLMCHVDKEFNKCLKCV